RRLSAAAVRVRRLGGPGPDFPGGRPERRRLAGVRGAKARVVRGRRRARRAGVCAERRHHQPLGPPHRRPRRTHRRPADAGPVAVPRTGGRAGASAAAEPVTRSAPTAPPAEAGAAVREPPRAPLPGGGRSAAIIGVAAVVTAAVLVLAACVGA